MPSRPPSNSDGSPSPHEPPSDPLRIVVRAWFWRLGVLAAVIVIALLTARAWFGRHPAQLVVFDGYGTPRRFVLEGRALEKLPAPGDATRPWYRNVGETWRALESDEVGDAPLRVEVLGHSYETFTDDQGLFAVAGDAREEPWPVGTHPIRARITGDAAAPAAEALLHVIDDSPGVALISDFDDTVARTHVTDPARLVRETALRNAAQLEPVDGAGPAYRAAMREGARAVFYVSGSPINFQPRILEFLQRNDLPRGPLLLKNFGQDPLFQQQGYKTGRIEGILTTFPKLRFVLVGDSGEQDPEIYRALRDAHPDRVAAILIVVVRAEHAQSERLRDMHAVGSFDDDPGLLARIVRHAAMQEP